MSSSVKLKLTARARGDGKVCHSASVPAGMSMVSIPPQWSQLILPDPWQGHPNHLILRPGVSKIFQSPPSLLRDIFISQYSSRALCFL